jgi:hypothetical protein
LTRAVGALNRVALGELSSSELYTVEKDDTTGVITLTPADVIGATAKRPAEIEGQLEIPTHDGPQGDVF